LIIDSVLPPLNRPIPNDPDHLHFGAGQTEAEITLKPGRHSLQLVLGDKDHIPHMPPVMSPRIWVTVGEGPPGAGLIGGPTASPPGAEVYFADLKDGAVISPETTIHFGLKNMGIAPAGSDRENSGHHHLLIDIVTPVMIAVDHRQGLPARREIDDVLAGKQLADGTDDGEAADAGIENANGFAGSGGGHERRRGR